MEFSPAAPIVASLVPITRLKDTLMPGLRPDVDPDGLQEFSVVFTDRSVNHMSQKFWQLTSISAAA